MSYDEMPRLRHCGDCRGASNRKRQGRDRPANGPRCSNGPGIGTARPEGAAHRGLTQPKASRAWAQLVVQECVGVKALTPPAQNLLLEERLRALDMLDRGFLRRGIVDVLEV